MSVVVIGASRVNVDSQHHDGAKLFQHDVAMGAANTVLFVCVNCLSSGCLPSIN